VKFEVRGRETFALQLDTCTFRFAASSQLALFFAGARSARFSPNLLSEQQLDSLEPTEIGFVSHSRPVPLASGGGKIAGSMPASKHVIAAPHQARPSESGGGNLRLGNWLRLAQFQLFALADRRYVGFSASRHSARVGASPKIGPPAGLFTILYGVVNR
jgi:hypothetical protein